MDKQVCLVKPSMELKDTYLSFYREWKDSGQNIVPYVVNKDPSDFKAMLQYLFDSEKGDNMPENWVPDTTYWLVDEVKKVVGAVNIRHRLTERLFNSGGHIGYGIRPSERRKGYATKLLGLARHLAGRYPETCEEHGSTASQLHKKAICVEVYAAVGNDVLRDRQMDFARSGGKMDRGVPAEEKEQILAFVRKRLEGNGAD